MKARHRHVSLILELLSLLIICSCATAPTNRYGLPRTIAFAAETGRGGLLIVRVKLESGEQVPFLLDTGTAITCLDQSLEPKLGRRLGPATVIHFGVKHEGSLYPAPRLFIGNTLLRSGGTNIATFDFRRTAPDGVLRFLGVLGMDVLKNYRMQVDFDAHRLRFFKSNHPAPRSWGKVFPLTTAEDGCPALMENFLGATSPVSIVDSGFNYDGWLTPDCFQQWTNQPPRWDYGQNSFYYGRLGGEVYISLNLREIDKRSLATEDSHIRINGIGLRFLARHLVTFDFPNRRMYLKRTSVGPLVADQMKIVGDAAGRSAFEYAWRLKKRGQLAGWSKTDKLGDDNYSFNVTFLTHPDSDLEPQARSDLEQQTIVTLYNIRKKGDASIYFYEVRRVRRTDSWKIEKAWRTDSDGRILEHLLP
jgi:hypothetical protein